MKFDLRNPQPVAGERPKEEGAFLRTVITIAALAALGYGLFPWIVKGLWMLFGPLVHYI